MDSSWSFFKAVIDGERLEIDGLNVWDFDWINTGDTVNVKDPLYGEPHVLTTYRIITPDKVITFSATEFSNCIWGFYILNDARNN